MAKAPGAPLVWPEAAAGWGARLTFGYITPLLRLGATGGRTLSPDDLYAVSPVESAVELRARFRAAGEGADAFATFKARAWRLVRPTMLPAAGCQLIASGGQVVQPLLLRALVAACAMDDAAAARAAALRLAGATAACVLLTALAQQHQTHLALRSGQRLRAAVIAEVYGATLAGRAGERGGDERGGDERGGAATNPTNLVANDAQKLFEVTLNANLLWAAPLTVVVVSALLLHLVGAHALAGIATLCAVLPVARRVVKSMMQLRARRMPVADERVRVLSEVLAGLAARRRG